MLGVLGRHERALWPSGSARSLIPSTTIIPIALSRGKLEHPQQISLPTVPATVCAAVREEGKTL